MPISRISSGSAAPASRCKPCCSGSGARTLRRPGRSSTLRAKLRHDLRTPINAIKGYGEMLAEDAEGGHEVLLADLGKLLTAANGMLRRDRRAGRFPAAVAPKAPARGRRPAWAACSRRSRAIAALPRPPPARRSAAAFSSSTTMPPTAICSAVSWSAPAIPSARPRAGTTALAKLESESFDLILLDMMMPDISGYEVLRRLKARAAHGAKFRSS